MDHLESFEHQATMNLKMSRMLEERIVLKPLNE